MSRLARFVSRRQVTRAVLALTMAALSIAACDGKRETEVSLRLKWLFDPGFAGEMVAAKAGIFEKNGLGVEIKPGGFEADPIKLVASGSDTFGHAGADSFLLARAAGVPIVALAAGYLATPVVFYVRKDSDIHTPKDFVGKRVGYQAGQDTATVYEALLKKAGVSRDEVKEVPVKFDFTPFLTGDVDVWPGYAATQSYVLEQRGIPYRVIKPADFGVSYLGTVYFTRAENAVKSEKNVRAFVCSVVEGWHRTYENPDDAVKYISEFDPKVLTPSLITHNLRAQYDTIRPPGRQFGLYSENDWQTTIKEMQSQKLLPSPLDISFSVNFAFVEACYSPQ
jgi:NitT/TauT family transport system substrate-binding protein